MVNIFNDLESATSTQHRVRSQDAEEVRTEREVNAKRGGQTNMLNSSLRSRPVP